MKKNFYYAMISAALLTGAAGFSACSSDDVVTEVNPNLSEDGKAVKTQFALNIPRAKSGRMTGATTQQDGTSFRGMEGIKLIPLTTEGYTGSGDAHVMISLKNIGKDDDDFKGHVKVYSDVSIPVGTKGFLFYGHAAEGEHADPTKKDGLHKFDLGKLVPQKLEVNQAPSSYEFALKKIYSGIATSTDPAQAILTALNAIVAVKDWANDKELGKLYGQFTSLKAGSANSVLAAVQSLYYNVANYGENTTGGKIKQAICNNFNVKDNNVAWKDGNSFPTNLNLPEGCVELTFSKSKNEFEYGTKSGIGGGTSSVSVSSITFPASLYYMANTGVKANSSPTVTWPILNEWANGFTDWNSEVMPTTRKIALANTVNYAVAQLVTTFTCDAETLPAKTITINDNKIEQYVPVNTKEGGFPVTGLLIGGQPTKVNYDFLPASTDGFTNTIYDNAIEDGVKANVKSDGNTPTANYTLLLSNWKKDADKENQNKVNFAVELKNNSGVAFQGADGLVPVDGTFYLIGTLNPKTNKNQNIVVENPSVFMRDYKTTAKINITTLATAYNTIPDLRATNLELGLAVDLEWQEGMEFEVEIGGEETQP